VSNHVVQGYLFGFNSMLRTRRNLKRPAKGHIR
jgi:hypothetical protein